MAAGLGQILGTTPKLTDEEVKEGAPVREDFRKFVLENQKILDSGKDIFKTLNVSTKELSGLIEKELAWLNANVEVSKRQIDSRRTAFNESVSLAVNKLIQSSLTQIQTLPPGDQTRIANSFPIEKARPQLLAAASSNMKAEAKKEEDKRTETLKKTPTDVAIDAGKQALKYGTLLLILFFGLRSASLAVNENLWRPYPYRILIFFYTLLFFPIWIPYYIVQSIRGKTEFEGFFPAFSYDPTEPLTLLKRLFGYGNSIELCQLVNERREDWKQRQLDILKSS